MRAMATPGLAVWLAAMVPCGWNRAAQWYDCGFVGSDPSLVADTPCPITLPFEGCCDAGGNVWYCDESRVINTSC